MGARIDDKETEPSVGMSTYLGISEIKIVEANLLSSNAISELLYDVRADLEPVTKQSPVSCGKTRATVHFLASGTLQCTIAGRSGIIYGIVYGVSPW